jgi:hypothetical protein
MPYVELLVSKICTATVDVPLCSAAVK